MLLNGQVDKNVVQVDMDESHEKLRNTEVINLWNVEEALQSPCCIT